MNNIISDTCYYGVKINGKTYMLCHLEYLI